MTKAKTPVSKDQLPPPVYLDREKAAAFLCISKHTLDDLRWKGIGPAHSQHSRGSKVIYDRNDLIAWVEENKSPHGIRASEKSGRRFSGRFPLRPKRPGEVF